MSDFLFELLVRSGGWLLCSGVIVFVTLRILKPDSPPLHRFAWFCVLVQGLFLGVFSVEIPCETTPREIPFSGSVTVIDSVTTMEDVAPAPESVAVHENLPAVTENQVPIFTKANGLTVWGFGIAALLLLHAAIYLRLCFVVLRSKPCEGEHLRQWLELLETLDVSPQRIALRLSSKHGPMLFCGLNFRNVILVPETLWENLSPENREGVLRHELAHYLHRDCYKNILSRLLLLPQWFNPMAWYALRRYEEAAEWASDRFAFAEHEDGLRRFAEILLAVNRTRKRIVIHVPSFFGSSVRRRLERLSPPAIPRKETKMKKALLITMGLLLLLCGLYRLELKGETRSGPDEATIQKAVATLHDVYEEQESYMLGVQLKPSEFDQISIECRFLTTRPEYVAPEGFTHQRGWRFVANAAGHEEGAFLRGNEILEQDSSEKKGILSFTESYSPALYRFLNQEQVEALLNLVLRDSRSEVLLAPKVTFFNGQAARVQDTNRSPWPRTNGASNFHVEFVDEGMKLNITAEHLGDNVIRLTACDIYSTKRREAERFQLYPGRDCMQGDKEGDNEVYDIYIPKIETTHVKIPVTLPKDHSLLLAIPGLLEDKESMLCVMIKGNILPNEEDEEMLREAIKSSSANVYESERKLPEPGEYQKKVYDEWERFWFADSPQSGAPQ